jgi:predicted membrane channel-forming protein YqfA (hemolysin III family)
MIASGIFFCLLLLLITTLRRHAWLSVVVFFVALGSLVLLFMHHATDALHLNL